VTLAGGREEPRLTVTIGGKDIAFETGAVAKQAHGAVLVKHEGTVVLATAVGRTEGREGADFFPLTVDVEEKMYAAGKIPGGFFKREGRAGEKAILTARMVDRPIRPLWPKGYKNEVQGIVTTFSADQVYPHDILAINGASAALMLSPMPFLGPVGAVRIGRLDGQLVVNPTLPDLKDSTLDLIVCGTPEAITMVEAGADEVSEEELIDALELAHAEIRKLCQLQIELADRAGLPKWADGAVTESLRSKYAPRLQAAIGEGGRGTRSSTTSPTGSSSASRPGPRRTAAGAACSSRLRGRRLWPRRTSSIRRPSAARSRSRSAAPMGAPRPRSARSRAPSASCRGRTARRSSPADRRRRSPCARWGRRRRSSASTTCRWTRRSATSTTTTSRRSASARPGSCAGRSGATSATARSPSGRSCR